MNCNEINIRDPFILKENGRFYLYGTRAAGFGVNVHGVDVYVSDNLSDWSEKTECLNSVKYGLDRGVNWAPEVHKYKDRFYMFITFTKENDLRGTYILSSDRPEGPFAPHSKGAVTPFEWECLDGTFFVENGIPYLVFCHEHTQIIDGTVCYVRLNDDLTEAVGEPVTLFSASSPVWADKKPAGEHYVTDGPFMYKSVSGKLFMIWSTFIKNKYAECIVSFDSGSIKGNFRHLDPITTEDGGHGMLFRDDKLYFTYHSPNSSGDERVRIVEVTDNGDTIKI